MEVRAWRNGKFSNPRVVYGIRVGVNNRAEHFQADWNSIVVEIDGTAHTFRLTAGFKHKCPEFRDSDGNTPIRDWLSQHHAIPWPKGKPPRFELHALQGNRFWLGD